MLFMCTHLSRSVLRVVYACTVQTPLSCSENACGVASEGKPKSRIRALMTFATLLAASPISAGDRADRREAGGTSFHIVATDAGFEAPDKIPAGVGTVIARFSGRAALPCGFRTCRVGGCSANEMQSVRQRDA
jgi:hypothetical protein